MLGQHDDLDRPRTGLGIPDLIDHQLRTGLGRDEGESFLFEERPERIGDHPARPWSPVEGDDATMRHPDGGLLCPLVEVLIGGGIGHLAGAAEPRRRRREEHQDRERFRVDRPEQVVQALDLGLVNQVELRVGLIGDPPIRQDARPVDQPTDRTELRRAPTRSSDAQRLDPARQRNDTRPASRPRRCDRGSGEPRAGP